MAKVAHVLHLAGMAAAVLSMIAVSGILDGREHIAELVAHRDHHGG
jgi:hypothetical protein